MKYSHKYSKLLNNRYTTIRRYPKGHVGKTVTEDYPGGKHLAKIRKIERKSFVQIPIELLLSDTDCQNRRDAFKLIQSFYRSPINPYTEKLYIYYMEKI